MAEPDRILCVRRGGLGDTLLILPILRAMRAARPTARLTFAGVAEFGDLFLAYGACDEVWSSERLATWSLAAPGDAHGAAARLREFAWIVGDDPALCAARDATCRVDIFDPRLGVDPPQPAAAQLLARAGLSGSADVTLGPTRAATSPDAPIAVHVGSGGRSKCWPTAALAALITALRARVFVGPAELERGVDWLPPGSDVCAPASPRALARELAGVRAFVGHDSGPTHLAAALRIPTLALFTTTEPRIWAPQGAHVHTLTGEPDVARAVDLVAHLAVTPQNANP